jgi:hypothetical protein
MGQQGEDRRDSDRNRGDIGDQGTRSAQPSQEEWDRSSSESGDRSQQDGSSHR